MKGIPIGIVAALMLLPAVSDAQVAPSPNLLTSQRPDLFQAAPDTYVPKRPEELGLLFPYAAAVWPVWGVPVGPVYEQPPVRVIVEHVVRHEAAPALPPPATVPPPATAPPAAGHKRTLYVIPGCYAGDKLPRRDQLRAGCSLKDLRTISPVL